MRSKLVVERLPRLQQSIRLIVEGYDPTIGVMHEKKGLRGINPGFALKPERPLL
jgi:hypothetical protein